MLVGPYFHKLFFRIILLALVMSALACSERRQANQSGASANASRSDGQTVALTEPAIRHALEKGGTVRLPAGRVDITQPLRITKSGTRLIGAGQDRTVLRMAFPAEAAGAAIVIPSELAPDGKNPAPASMSVNDIEIADLAIDGQRQGNPNTFADARPNRIRFGVFVTLAERVRLAHLHVYDIAGDAILVGNGSKITRDVTIEENLIERAARNGIALTSAERPKVLRNRVLDTPGVYWSDAGAGNGIDIETEGLEPRVTGALVEGNLVERAPDKFAGMGMQISRSFGPVEDVTVRGNRFRNHQTGIGVSNAKDVLIENNDFETAPAGEQKANGQGLFLDAASPGSTSVVVRNNRFWLEPWQGGAEAVTVAHGPGTWEFTDNVMRGGRRTFWCFALQPCNIVSTRNQWRTYEDGPFFVGDQPSTQTINDRGSARV